MKRPIEWHENVLKNKKDYRRRLKDEMDRAISAFNKIEYSIYVSELQIETAKKEGKDSFDPDRYLYYRDILNKARNGK